MASSQIWCINLYRSVTILIIPDPRLSQQRMKFKTCLNTIGYLKVKLPAGPWSLTSKWSLQSMQNAWWLEEQGQPFQWTLAKQHEAVSSPWTLLLFLSQYHHQTHSSPSGWTNAGIGVYVSCIVKTLHIIIYTCWMGVINVWLIFLDRMFMKQNQTSWETAKMYQLTSQ